MWFNIAEGVLWFVVALTVGAILAFIGYCNYIWGYAAIGTVISLLGGIAWCVLTSYGVMVGSGTVERKLFRD